MNNEAPDRVIRGFFFDRSLVTLTSFQSTAKLLVDPRLDELVKAIHQALAGVCRAGTSHKKDARKAQTGSGSDRVIARSQPFGSVESAHPIATPPGLLFLRSVRSV
ncbi:MAG TPA: hypothetical protein VFS76_12610 [Pyrinomonadaceae bacterium]|nr:hypothetical protein [Pyrinomonadaceae bacterium]